MVLPFAENGNTGTGASWEGGDGGSGVEAVELQCRPGPMGKMASRVQDGEEPADGFADGH